MVPNMTLTHKCLAPQLSRGDQAWLGPHDKLTATWSSADAESGIVKTEYCVGTLPVGCQMQPMTELPANATTVTCHNCQLGHLQTYYVSVRVWNGAGLATVATTEGVHVDLTPPHLGDVLMDKDFVPCTRNCSLYSNITVISEPESGVKSCSYAIADSNGFVTPFVNNSQKPGIQASGVELAAGKKYWTVVRCENNVGLVTERVSSAAALVDDTPPTQVNPDHVIYSDCFLLRCFDTFSSFFL